MPNRSTRFTAITLIFAALGLGWELAWASAVYLPHRMLPTFVPATAYSDVASFTPHYRFRPLAARPGARIYRDVRMSAPGLAPGYRSPASRVAYRAAARQWVNGFRFRPLPPSRGMPLAYHHNGRRAMPSLFPQYPAPTKHQQSWRFSSLHPAAWPGARPGGAALRYAAPRPIPAHRYRPGWQPIGADYQVAGYRFRPLAEPGRWIAGGRVIHPRPAGRHPAVAGFQFRPLAKTLRHRANLPQPAALAANRAGFSGFFPPQPRPALRFRPDRRFAAVAQPPALPAFPIQGHGYSGFGYGVRPKVNVSQRLVWRPLDERQTRLARQASALGELGVLPSNEWPQPGYPLPAGQL